MSFKKCLLIMVLLASIIIISLFPTNDNVSETSTEIISRPKIILDAGHGGFDGGAVALDGTVEKEINLKITLYLYDMLNVSGYDVILTRQTDDSIEDNSNDVISERKKSDMKNRLELMNTYKNSIFISIHLNKFTTSSARGSQVFYSGNLPQSKELGDCIQGSIVSNLQPENKRVNKRSGNTYLLKNAAIPAVLVECGFLSNKNELASLKLADYQKKLAFCIFYGINQYISNSKQI